MWISEQNRRRPAERGAAELGRVTLGGDPAAVDLGGERRWLAVYGPGGYAWRPAPGDRVLVLKAGTEGECPCVLGVTQSGEELEPGEVRLTGKGGRLSLKGDGVELTGPVKINGVALEQYILSVAARLLGEQEE